jgi:hypothetical protein
MKKTWLDTATFLGLGATLRLTINESRKDRWFDRQG